MSHRRPGRPLPNANACPTPTDAKVVGRPGRPSVQRQRLPNANGCKSVSIGLHSPFNLKARFSQILRRGGRTRTSVRPPKMRKSYYRGDPDVALFSDPDADGAQRQRPTCLRWPHETGQVLSQGGDPDVHRHFPKTTKSRRRGVTRTRTRLPRFRPFASQRRRSVQSTVDIDAAPLQLRVKLPDI